MTLACTWNKFSPADSIRFIYLKLVHYAFLRALRKIFLENESEYNDIKRQREMCVERENISK